MSRLPGLSVPMLAVLGHAARGDGVGHAGRRGRAVPAARAAASSSTTTSATSSTSSSPTASPTWCSSSWTARAARSSRRAAPPPSPSPGASAVRPGRGGRHDAAPAHRRGAQQPHRPRVCTAFATARRRRQRRRPLAAACTGWASGRPRPCPTTSRRGPARCGRSTSPATAARRSPPAAGTSASCSWPTSTPRSAHLGPATLHGRGLGAYVALLTAGARPDLVRGAVLDDGPGLAGGGAEPTTPFVLGPPLDRRARPTPTRCSSSATTSGRPTTPPPTPARPPRCRASTPRSPSAPWSAHPGWRRWPPNRASARCRVPAP